MYRIREVDASDDDAAEQIEYLHNLTSNFPALDQSDYDNGFWWIGYIGKEPVSYAGIIPSTIYERAGYFKRVGVVPEHRGHGLQSRHMRVMEQKARGLGWSRIVSDTTGNTHSANNFIRAGYRLFEPETAWAFESSLYWTKSL